MGQGQEWEQESEQKISAADQLESVKFLLEEYAKPLLTEDETKISIVMPRIVQVMNIIFPLVIRDYEEPVFAQRQEEIPVWVDLLRTITETMEGSDTFAKMDIIYEVLIPNLAEHIDILRQQEKV